MASAIGQIKQARRRAGIADGGGASIQPKTQVVGTGEVKRNLRRTIRRIQKEMAEIVLEAVDPLIEAASRKAPVRTGRLAENQGVEIKKKRRRGVTAWVGPTRDAPHGVFAELGTEHHPAQPFLRPALDETKDEVIENIVKGVAKEIGSAL